MSENTIESVFEKHRDRIMTLRGVLGTSIGRCMNEPCIRVFVIEKTKELLDQIPCTLDGYPVMVQETGEFRALDT